VRNFRKFSITFHISSKKEKREIKKTQISNFDKTLPKKITLKTNSSSQYLVLWNAKNQLFVFFSLFVCASFQNKITIY